MLSFFNLSEAVAWLSQSTGQIWTASHLFEVAVAHGIELQAAIPPGVGTITARRESDTTSRLEDILDHPLAQLSARQVKQLWLAGATETNKAADLDGELGEYSQLGSFVRVTATDVRISAASLRLICAATPKGGVPTTPCPVPRFSAQDQAILDEIKVRGFQPTAIPKHRPGKRGLKAEVKSTLLARQGGLFSVSSFDHAWERLRSAGDIRDAEDLLPSP